MKSSIVMNSSDVKKSCLVIGDPIGQSLSPVMHNAGYAELNLDFHFSSKRVKPEDLEHFLGEARQLNTSGISVTVPHKVAVMDLLDSLDDTAVKIGAVNTIVRKGVELRGYNTDWLGVVRPLEQRINLDGKHVAVIGAGGSARAAVFGLCKHGALVTVYNRNQARAEGLAADFGARFRPLSEIAHVADADIVVHCTSVGMNSDDCLLTLACFHSEQLVMDAVYKPLDTALLGLARAAGAQTIDGLKMLLFQGAEQFQLYTGQPAPIDVMSKALYA